MLGMPSSLPADAVSDVVARSVRATQEDVSKRKRRILAHRGAGVEDLGPQAAFYQAGDIQGIVDGIRRGDQLYHRRFRLQRADHREEFARFHDGVHVGDGGGGA